MMDINNTEAQIEGYLIALRDTVATLNRSIDKLQTTLSQIRGRMSELKIGDQVPHLASRMCIQTQSEV